MISFLRKAFLLRPTCIKRNSSLTVLISPTRVTLGNMLISSVDHTTHFLPNTRILYFLVILMHVLMMRLYKHFANFILCIVSLNNLHALKISRTLAALIYFSQTSLVPFKLSVLLLRQDYLTFTERRSLF